MLRATGHRNVASVRQRYHSQRILQPLPPRNIPRHNRYRPHIQLRRIQRQHQGHRIIGARIRVQNNLLRPSSPPRRRAQHPQQSPGAPKRSRKPSHRQVFDASIPVHRLSPCKARPVAAFFRAQLLPLLSRMFHPRATDQSHSFVFAPTRRELTKATNKIPATTPSDNSTEICTHGSTIIFAPMNVKTSESPTVKYRNRPKTPAKRKYIARSPK